MAKLFITSFDPWQHSVAACRGFFQAGDVFIAIDLENVPFDPTISTSVRQQILDGIVDAANIKLVEYGPGVQSHLPLIATDIEMIS